MKPCPSCAPSLLLTNTEIRKKNRNKNRNKNKNQSQATRRRYAEPSVAEPVLLLPTWSPLVVNCPLNISWCWISDVSQDGSYRYRSRRPAAPLLTQVRELRLLPPSTSSFPTPLYKKKYQKDAFFFSSPTIKWRILLCKSFRMINPMMALPAERTNLASFIFFFQVTSSLLSAESSQQTVRGHLKEFFAALAACCPGLKLLRIP